MTLFSKLSLRAATQLHPLGSTIGIMIGGMEEVKLTPSSVNPFPVFSNVVVPGLAGGGLTRRATAQAKREPGGYVPSARKTLIL